MITLIFSSLNFSFKLTSSLSITLLTSSKFFRRSLQLREEDYFWTEIGGRKIFYSLDTFFQANLHILPGLFKTIRGFDIWEDDTCFYDLYGGVVSFG